MKLYSIVCIGAVAVGVLAFKGQKAVEQYEIPAPLKDRPEQVLHARATRRRITRRRRRRTGWRGT